jgi:hypothetical protein
MSGKRKPFARATKGVVVIGKRKPFMMFETLEIDETDLAERVLNGGALHQHEREHLADMLTGKKQNPRNRPPSIVTVLKAVLAAHLVFFFETARPKMQRTTSIAAVAHLQGVCQSTVSKAVAANREMEAAIKASAASWKDLDAYVKDMEKCLADDPSW